MNIRNIILAASGLVLGASIAFSLSNMPKEPDVAAAAATGSALVGGSFSLVDQTGKHVTDKDFLGRPLLVFFGYTNCPDICPSGLQVMAAALDKLSDRAKTVTPIFVTLDPARDTPEKLAQYVKSFSPRLVGLTGSEADIANAAKAYRVYYQKVEDGKANDAYFLDHSAIFYLMGPDGKFITAIPHTTDVDKLAAALDKSLP